MPSMRLASPESACYHPCEASPFLQVSEHPFPPHQTRPLLISTQVRCSRRIAQWPQLLILQSHIINLNSCPTSGCSSPLMVVVNIRRNQHIALWGEEQLLNAMHYRIF